MGPQRKIINCHYFGDHGLLVKWKKQLAACTVWFRRIWESTLEPETESEEVLDHIHEGTPVDKALQLEYSFEVKRGRGRPHKHLKVVQDVTPKRPHGIPRKKRGGSELVNLYLDGQDQQLIHADWGSEEGITTRAKRALIRSHNAGLIPECSEEEAVQGLIPQIYLGSRR